MENDVKVLKLVTGEEVVARVNKTFDGLMHLEKPLIYEPIKTKRGEDWSGTLVPWLKTSLDGVMSIPPEHILFEGNPTKEVERYYLSSVTGLTL